MLEASLSNTIFNVSTLQLIREKYTSKLMPSLVSHHKEIKVKLRSLIIGVCQ
jgi:hypothetical protein